MNNQIELEEKKDRGIDWLENIFLASVLPLYFHFNITPQESFSTDGMGIGEYIIDSDINLNKNEITCWLEYQCNEQQFALANSKLEKDYNSYEKPFRNFAIKEGFEPQILSIQNLEHIVFQIVIL